MHVDGWIAWSDDGSNLPTTYGLRCSSVNNRISSVTWRSAAALGLDSGSNAASFGEDDDKDVSGECTPRNFSHQRLKGSRCWGAWDNYLGASRTIEKK